MTVFKTTLSFGAYLAKPKNRMSIQTCKLVLLLFAVVLQTVAQQNLPDTQPTADESDCICKFNETICRCTFVIEHKLTMILEAEKQVVYPSGGYLKQKSNSISPERNVSEEEMKRVITADGEGSRLVITVNGKFPGPRIEVFQNQMLELKVVNKLHTDSVTIHFHGLHQIGTPWMDGVAAVSQCPILPGQTFVYRFKATPEGSAMYHAHIADQRSMGLYGPLIVRLDPTKVPDYGKDEIIVSLQDWNHLMNAETAYNRMLTEQFDFTKMPPEIIPTTFSLDGGKFSRFVFHSGLINGKGRYWRSAKENNGAPLERFKVITGRLYRFRVIGAMTLYPMKVYIPGHKVTVIASDGFRLTVKTNFTVSYFIIQPGERVDFIWSTPSSPNTQQYMLVAESIETPESIGGKYHAAEAILEVEDSDPTLNLDPPKSIAEICSTNSPCLTFNCPYDYNHAVSQSVTCLNFDDVDNVDDDKDLQAVLGDSVDIELFFNFGFPGFNETPGSVNGREFVPPSSPLLTQLDQLTTACNETACTQNGVCKCTYMVSIPENRKVQMIFTNIGRGAGWSHPIHLHGHSFYVLKTGLGTYDNVTGRLIDNTQDINCTDRYNFCSTAAWTNESWAMGNLPGMNERPPEKDTIIVPTGGYVVIRFISNNPGMWFLHCHIDLHNTNGMGMVINEAYDRQPAAPPGFPVCGDFLYEDEPRPKTPAINCGSDRMTISSVVTMLVLIMATWQTT